MVTSTTSSSYYYTTGSMNTSEGATIIKTKQPAQQWSDVTEISWGGHRYKIGGIVKITTAMRPRFGRIEGFETDVLTLATVDGPGCKFYYGEIKPIEDGDKPDIKPDPNRAFLTRKKGIL